MLGQFGKPGASRAGLRGDGAIREFSGRLSQKLCDFTDELFGGMDRRAGAVERYVVSGSSP